MPKQSPLLPSSRSSHNKAQSHRRRSMTQSLFLYRYAKGGADHWDKDDYDVRLGDASGAGVGRIMRHSQAPEAQPWFWTITAREQPASVVSIETHYMTALKGVLESRSTRPTHYTDYESRWERSALGFIILSIHCPSFIVIPTIDFAASRLRRIGIFTSIPEASKTSSSTRIKPQEQFASSALEIVLPLASYHTNTIT